MVFWSFFESIKGPWGAAGPLVIDSKKYQNTIRIHRFIGHLNNIPSFVVLHSLNLTIDLGLFFVFTEGNFTF